MAQASRPKPPRPPACPTFLCCCFQRTNMKCRRCLFLISDTLNVGGKRTRSGAGGSAPHSGPAPPTAMLPPPGACPPAAILPRCREPALCACADARRAGIGGRVRGGAAAYGLAAPPGAACRGRWRAGCPGWLARAWPVVVSLGVPAQQPSSVLGREETLR